MSLNFTGFNHASIPPIISWNSKSLRNDLSRRSNNLTKIWAIDLEMMITIQSHCVHPWPSNLDYWCHADIIQYFPITCHNIKISYFIPNQVDYYVSRRLVPIRQTNPKVNISSPINGCHVANATSTMTHNSSKVFHSKHLNTFYVNNYASRHIHYIQWFLPIRQSHYFP